MMRNTITALRSRVGSMYPRSNATNVNSNTPRATGHVADEGPRDLGEHERAEHHAERKVTSGGSGSTAQSTAATSTQSTHAMATCARAAIRPGRREKLQPKIRIARR